jgi:hypothetical protein
MTCIDDLPTASFTDERNKFGVWHEKVTNSDIPTLETRHLKLDHSAGGMPEFDIDEAIQHVDALGGEAFTRCEYKSAALDLNAGSYVPTATEKAVEKTVHELISQQVMMEMPIGEWVHFREWVDLSWVEYGRRTCHPEVRFFVEDGEVLCHHLRGDFGGNDGLKDQAQRYIDPDNGHYPRLTEQVHEYAQVAANLFEDDCRRSIDFALDTDHNWWFIDSAIDALYERHGGWHSISAHPGDCEHDLESQID